MKLKYDDILWWDQDVLNTVCDGDYLELDLNLNFRANFDTFETTKILNLPFQEILPWNQKQLVQHTLIFIRMNTESTNKKYHLEFKNKSFKRSSNKLIKFGKIKEIDFPINFMLLFIGKLFKYIIKKNYLKFL